MIYRFMIQLDVEAENDSLAKMKFCNDIKGLSFNAFIPLVKKRNIMIPLTESDIEHLRDGGQYDWRFSGIDVLLYKEEEEEDEEDDKDSDWV